MHCIGVVKNCRHSLFAVFAVVVPKVIIVVVNLIVIVFYVIIVVSVIVVLGGSPFIWIGEEDPILAKSEMNT